jgi:heterodisulfide reductase subunit A
MGNRIGVYVCSCGTNISETVDVGRLVGEAGSMEDVVAAKTHSLLCSEEGKQFLEEEIRANELDRVVVAACSPRQHEPTFQKVCAAAGLNPFLMQMTNIRELCSWVTEDPAGATGKASHLLRAAVSRVKFHSPLSAPDVECSPDALVIGAGVAGMEAALLLAQKGRKVTLVEKSPCIGGMLTRYEDVFPGMECATCMLEPKMDEILHRDNIELLTCSEVEEVFGFFGNFKIKIRRRARFIDVNGCFGCNACLDVCPVKVDNEYNEGLDKRGAIYVPYTGALPNVPAIDRENCLRFRGEECSACADACGFGAVVYDQEDEIIERNVGAVVIATGFGMFDCSSVPNLGYGKYDNIVTSLELERIISSTGPTGGNVVLKDGSAPRSVAIVQCVGSRDKAANNYCSGICCMNAMKLSHLLKKKLGNVDARILFSDMCIPGEQGQELFDSSLDEGARFIRVADTKDISVEKKGGSLIVNYRDAAGAAKSDAADMVVLSPAIVPGPDTLKLSALFSVNTDKKGFFAGIHDQMGPVATCLKGVYIAGCAQGPVDIRNSVLQGKAAAGEALSALIPGEKLEVEAITAFINEEVCSGCRICNTMCPFKAISFDEEKGVSVVNEVLCRGCGTCAAACPGAAAVSRHFDKQQIFAEIAGVLR